MYAFAQREDTVAYDEPLYASFLARTGADHPGREEASPIDELNRMAT